MVFASNKAAATGLENGTQIFLPAIAPRPADPAPIVVAAPVLDTGRSPTDGGLTACLGRSRMTTPVNQALGIQYVVEAVDSPGDNFRRDHIGFAGSTLNHARFHLAFTAYLSVWTDVNGAIGSTDRAANRLYNVLLSVPWNVDGEWDISAAGGRTATVGPTAVIGATVTYNPSARASTTNVEVRPPSGVVDLLSQDAQH